MIRGETKNKILKAAFDLFLEKGYTATTVDEICTRAGASKGSLFHYFATKEALALEVINTHYGSAMEKLKNGYNPAIPDPVERALAFVDFTKSVAPEFWSNGCLLGNLTTQLTAVGPAIQKLVTGMFGCLAKNLEPVFRPVAEKSGADFPNARHLSELYLAIIEGALIMAKANNDYQRLPQGLDSFKRYLQLLGA